MKIVLANGIELEPIMVTGASQYVQGANRDALTFVFSDSLSMDQLDEIFTEDACETINIVGDDDSEAIHNGYVIRTELTKKKVVVTPGTADADEVSENRVTVTMAQRTYAESKMARMEKMLGI